MRLRRAGSDVQQISEQVSKQVYSLGSLLVRRGFRNAPSIAVLRLEVMP